MQTNPEDDALGDEHPEWKRDNGMAVGVGPIIWGGLAVIAILTVLLAFGLSKII